MVHQLIDTFQIVVTGAQAQFCGHTCPYLQKFNSFCFLYNRKLNYTSTKIHRASRCIAQSHQPHTQQLQINQTA